MPQWTLSAVFFVMISAIFPANETITAAVERLREAAKAAGCEHPTVEMWSESGHRIVVHVRCNDTPKEAHDGGG